MKLLPNDPLSRLDAQVQFQLAVNAIDQFVIPSVTST